MTQPTTNMDDIIARMNAEREANAADADEQRGALALKMFVAGVRHIMVTFSGGDDSGQIDEVNVKMSDGRMLDPKLDADEQMLKEIETWCDRYLEGTGVDWYNNEGGFGEIEFDMPMWPGRFRAEVSQYEQTSSVVHSEEDAA